MRAARTRVRTVAFQFREGDPAAADRMEALAREVLDGLGALDRSLSGAGAARASIVHALEHFARSAQRPRAR
ncbi:MAG TPA: hypothetical protein VGB42_08435 [Candidatus Thermoplasmatota archaeon]